MLLLDRTLLKMTGGLKRYIFGIVLLHVLVLLGTVWFADAVSGFLGDLFDPQMTGAQLRGAIGSAAVSALVMLVGQVLIGEAEFLCNARARTNLREKILDKIFQLDVGRIEQLGAANAVNLAASGVESMQSYYSRYLPSLIYCFVGPVYMFLRLYRVSVPVAVLLGVVTICILPLNNLFRSVIEKLKSGYWNGLHDLTANYLEGLRGMTTLILFNRDEQRTSELKDLAYRFYSNIMDVMKINFASFLMNYGLIYSSIVAAVLIACVQLGRDDLSLRSALLVLMLSFSFFSSVRELSMASHYALNGVAAAQKVSDLLEMDVSVPYEAPKAAPERQERGITLDHVRFAYSGRNPVLQDVSMRIEEGKVTAIVGPSGCGKSTVAALLMRFLEPEQGRLYLDGRPYHEYHRAELRKRVIMVPQRVGIFTGTVRENLRMADPKATDAELWSVCAAVGLESWLRTCPQGLDAPVGNAGARLSGGQRQKIGIARALLSRAEYILFDEATSSVDMESEADIWRCIRELSQSHTVIIISHRLSTIRSADRIYVLSAGSVAGTGRHAELLAACPLYESMVAEQEILEKMGEEVQHHGK